MRLKVITKPVPSLKLELMRLKQVIDILRSKDYIDRKATAAFWIEITEADAMYVYKE